MVQIEFWKTSHFYCLSMKGETAWEYSREKGLVKMTPGKVWDKQGTSQGASAWELLLWAAPCPPLWGLRGSWPHISSWQALSPFQKSWTSGTQTDASMWATPVNVPQEGGVLHDPQAPSSSVSLFSLVHYNNNLIQWEQEVILLWRSPWAPGVIKSASADKILAPSLQTIPLMGEGGNLLPSAPWRPEYPWRQMNLYHLLLQDPLHGIVDQGFHMLQLTGWSQC